MKYLYLVILCCTFTFSFAQHCAIHPPVNLQISDVTACSIKLSWSKIPEASSYQVRYKASSASEWNPKITVGDDTFYVFTGLDTKKKYDLSVRSICSDNTKSPFIKQKGVTLACSLPIGITAIATSESSISISWTGICKDSITYIRFKTQNGSWITTTAPGDGPAVISGLMSDSTYLYQISTCSDTTNNWTPVNTFNFAFSPPNIILIILDDARYDFYSCNGAPSFFQTPNIDRIAKEGVNFKNYFSTCSICAPSRACMASGLYPLENGATSNDSQIDSSLPTVDEILHDHGYYTGLIGKNHGTFIYDKKTYDLWMTSESTDIDSLKKFKYNSDNILIPGFITDIITDTAIALIERVNKPLFLWLGYSITHNPLVPEPQYDGIFDDESMPLTNDTLKYTENYPSFLDSFNASRLIGGQDMIDQYKMSYEAIASMDYDMSLMFSALESTGKLNNTLLIFVSDNGHLYGEHGLYMKRLAYEPSLRIPLFARYPAWFDDSTVITNQIALNIDIAPTVLEAAGIPNIYDMDGVSLHQLSKGSATRSEMYYQYLYTTEAGFGNVPSIRGVRDLKYKYIYYGCQNNTTEEFFDLVNDADEMTNLVNTSSYQRLIQQYRDQLTYYKSLYGDTLPETKLNCYIKNPNYTKNVASIDASSFLHIYPNPTSGNFTIVLPGQEKYTLQVMNSFGQVVFDKEGTDSVNEISLAGFPAGMYFIQYRDSNRRETMKLMVE